MTDVAGITALLASANEQPATRSPEHVADLLRQLVYLPNATILVALNGRRMLGAAMLSLRPSVMAGGLVGTVDMLTIDPSSSSDGVDAALLTHILTSARNKGCVAVEAEPASDRPAELWARTGFIEGRTRLVLGQRPPHRSPA